MLRSLAEPLILFLSSFLTLVLNYYKVSIATYQQIIVLLMVALLVLFNRFSKNPLGSNILTPQRLLWLILFITSLFTQLLVFSTGGLFSPFLILFHLFSLATSFLISIQASLSFLVLAITVLGVNVALNPAQQNLLKDDPGSVLLYLISFIIIVPLAHLITSKYHLKDQLSKILTQKVRVEEMILESLKELVLITDTNLRIMSVNDAAIKILKQSEVELIDKPIFDVLDLKDEEGKPGNANSLSVDRALADNATRIIKGFLLYIKGKTIPYQVTVQVQPISNSEGQVQQLFFIITQGKTSFSQKEAHPDLQKAETRAKLLLNQLKTQLQDGGFGKLNTEVELLEKIEEDISISKDLEDHNLNLESTLTDFAEVCFEVVEEKQTLSSGLNVNLQFSLPEKDMKELSLLRLKKSDYGKENLPVSDYAITLDRKWFKVMLEKVADLAIFISSGIKSGVVKLALSRYSDYAFNIGIETNFGDSFFNEDDVFKKYFGSLYDRTNLKLGSGLEGFIAKSISTQLSIPLSVKRTANTYLVSFDIKLNRKVAQ